jgi:hypothetical protein
METIMAETRDETVEQKNKIQVHAIRYHTYEGVAYDIGDEYEADEEEVENLRNLGMAHRSLKIEALPTPTPRPAGHR